MDQPIEFVNDRQERLAGTLHRPQQSTTYGIVLGHCFTCSRHTGILRQLAADLAQAGFMALRFDFSGNGQSQGRFESSTYSQQMAEMKAAMDVLHGQGVRWFGLAGHSLGASIAVLTAGRSKRVRAACALAGRLSGMAASHFLSRKQRSDLSRVGKVDFISRGRKLNITADFFADAHRYDLPQQVHNLRKPLLVVHGDRDEIIPVQEALNARSLNPACVELTIVAGADHMFGDASLRQEVSQQVVAWFDRQRAEAHPVFS